MTKQSILPAGVWNNYNESFESRENFKIEGKLKKPIKMEVTMKHSTKGFFVILAIVMSFVLVQGVWAVADIVTLKGKVITVENCAIGIDIDDNGETDVTVYHIGPKWYYNELGMTYPEIGMTLSIEAYLNTDNNYVCVSVSFDETTTIQLRDDDTLKPLWTQHIETTDLSGCLDGGDCEPVDNDYDKDYDYSYQSKGPHKK